MYGVLALVLASIAALPVTGWLKDTDKAEPVPVPAVVTSHLAAGGKIVFPDRNVFGPDGKPWEAPPAPVAVDAGKAAAASAGSTVSGVVKIDNIEGVISEKGFVKVGEPLGQGTLREIGDGSYVLQNPGGINEVPLDPGRKQRRDSLLQAPPPPKPPSFAPKEKQ
jgi:hypothetical protein